MARSRRDLKKKKEAQLVALPSRFGVRPRYRAASGRSVAASERISETVVREAVGARELRWTAARAERQHTHVPQPEPGIIH